MEIRDRSEEELREYQTIQTSIKITNNTRNNTLEIGQFSTDGSKENKEQFLKKAFFPATVALVNNDKATYQYQKPTDRIPIAYDVKPICTTETDGNTAVVSARESDQYRQLTDPSQKPLIWEGSIVTMPQSKLVTKANREDHKSQVSFNRKPLLNPI